MYPLGFEEWQSAKASFLMISTESGIVKVCRWVQQQKAPLPISVQLFEIVTFVKDAFCINLWNYSVSKRHVFQKWATKFFQNPLDPPINPLDPPTKILKASTQSKVYVEIILESSSEESIPAYERNTSSKPAELLPPWNLRLHVALGSNRWPVNKKSNYTVHCSE